MRKHVLRVYITCFPRVNLLIIHVNEPRVFHVLKPPIIHMIHVNKPRVLHVLMPPKIHVNKPCVLH